jgi:acetyl-CoA carboxylase beta subunit
MTDYLKHCMCGCIYEQANCPNCNKTPDRELLARLRDIAVHSYLGRTFVEAAADRIEALLDEGSVMAGKLDSAEIRIKELEAGRKKAYESLLKVTRIHDEVEAKAVDDLKLYLRGE